MDQEERAELVQQMFALLTGKFEDGAGIAVDGQAGGASMTDLNELAQRLHGIGHECMVISTKSRRTCGMSENRSNR